MFKALVKPVSSDDEKKLRQLFTENFMKKDENHECKACFQGPKMPLSQKDKDQLEYL